MQIDWSEPVRNVLVRDSIKEKQRVKRTTSVSIVEIRENTCISHINELQSDETDRD